MTIDIVVLLVVLGFALLSMPVYAFGDARRRPDTLEVPDRGSFVLGAFARDWLYWFVRPAERVSLALGLGPLFFNLLGAGFGIAAGAAFALGSLPLAGWAVLLGGVADILDGRIARALGVASRRGAFLDSTLDRFAEVGAFVGLAVFFRDSIPGLVLVVSALGGSLLVSYTRARGESVGIVCKLGVMQRAERLLLVGFGGLLDASASAWLGWSGGSVLLGAVGIVAVGTVGTAVFRTAWIASRLPRIDGSP